MYLLTNTNIARFEFGLTQNVVVLLIMDMESAKSDVNGPKKKVRFWLILTTKKVTITPKNNFQNI